MSSSQLWWPTKYGLLLLDINLISSHSRKEKDILDRPLPSIGRDTFPKVQQLLVEVPLFIFRHEIRKRGRLARLGTRRFGGELVVKRSTGFFIAKSLPPFVADLVAVEKDALQRILV